MIRLAAAAGDEPSAAAAVLRPATALLLVCVQLSEAAADMAVESQSVRLLLQLLRRPGLGAVTLRSVAATLQVLAGSKLGEAESSSSGKGGAAAAAWEAATVRERRAVLACMQQHSWQQPLHVLHQSASAACIAAACRPVYRDVLHGAGVVEVLVACLSDAACLADLSLLQVRDSRRGVHSCARVCLRIAWRWHLRLSAEHSPAYTAASSAVCCPVAAGAAVAAGGPV